MNPPIITTPSLSALIRTAFPVMPISEGQVRRAVTKEISAGSLPEYSFHWHGQSERLYLFEAPIDLLSFISMNKDGWQQHSYAACCGVADHVLWRMIKDNPHIEKVYLCLDNDEPGQQAAERIIGKLVEKGIPSEILTPTFKDWNEDLLFTEQEEEPCPILQL